MNMIDYAKKAVLENYANFNGRATRPEYWWFALFNFIIGIGLNILSLTVPLLGIVALLYSLATLIPNIAVGVRRLHDIGKSGWFLLVALIPLAGAVWLIVLLATEGQAGTNEYGPDPRLPVTGFDFEQQKLQP